MSGRRAEVRHGNVQRQGRTPYNYSITRSSTQLQCRYNALQMKEAASLLACHLGIAFGCALHRPQLVDLLPLQTTGRGCQARL